MHMDEYSVVIVDPIKETRRNNRLMLAATHREEDENGLVTSTMKVVGLASNADEAESIIGQTKPDIVTLEAGTLNIIPLILRISPASKILVSTSYNDKETIIQCIEEGASAYIIKPFTVDEFEIALKEIIKNNVYLASHAMLKIIDYINNISMSPTLKSFIYKLQRLDISGGMLTQLPFDLGNFPNLSTLDICDNRFAELPPALDNFPNLQHILASKNQITHIPSEIKEINNLKTLDLRNNPISIPPEILEKTDNPKAILNYYFTIQEIHSHIVGEKVDYTPEQIEIFKRERSEVLGLREINEIKLLIVGQGSVGKTSLVEQILHGTFDQNQTKTEGISINQWQVDGSRNRETESQSQSEIENRNSKIRLNIWDFGGQEIMHATHQFFLTKRSLYLLVLDARLTQEENRVEYWLKIIQSFGGESPVLIVGNKTDQHPLDIDRTGLQKKYPNIVGILETSAATGAGIEALKAEIAKQVDTLPHVRDLLPETWFTVKSKLEELGRDKNFITQDEYLNLCGANDVTDETSQHTLIGFLHDLGVVLHFQDDRRLAELGILNPQWVTNGVYKILNYKPLFENKGLLTLPLLDDVLNDNHYPKNKRLFIVDMMKKFELCYDIELDKSFLIPDLLPKDEIYTGEWNDALAFQYHYNVLPSSIITRFIVRMNAFIHKNTIWRTGAVLKRDANTALIKADIEDKKIYIYVGGKQDTRRELLAMIRGGFDAIHKTIAKIEVTEKVPVPNVPEAAPVDLSFLQQLAVEGRDKLQIEKEGKSSSPTNVYNIQNMYGAIGNNNTVNFIQQKFEPIYEAIESSSRDVTEKEDLIAEVDEIKNEIAKGDDANESFLSRRLRNLKKMAPDIAEVALSALAGPGAAFGTIVKNVAKKIKDETK